MKMLFACSLLIVNMGFLSNIQAVGTTDNVANAGNVPAPRCRHATSVEIFAAAFKAAMIVKHDPGVILGLQLPGKTAGERLYPVLFRILASIGLTNANCVAATAQRAVTVDAIFRLPVYFEKAIYCIGDFLFEDGVLNCDNAFELALEYFDFTQKVFGPLDATLVESYMTAVNQGLVEFLVSREVNLDNSEETWQRLANLFLWEYLKR